ncbi:hypothetical protein SRB17_49140 [Streptomyces sp. RB17]|nr:hypothetical protein [Streptomyces sp. RB17]
MKEADRVHAEPAVAAPEGQEWAIARRRGDTVPAPDGANPADTQVTSAATGCAASAVGSGMDKRLDLAFLAVHRRTPPRLCEPGSSHKLPD